MKTNHDYKHIGETYNQAAADKRQTNLWIFIGIAGLALLGAGFWILSVIYDTYYH